MIDTLYTPENKIVRTTYVQYFYKIRLYSHAYFTAYIGKDSTFYLYDYTEILRKLMNINTAPEKIISLYYCSIGNDKYDLYTKHDVSKLTLARVKEIVDNNFMILTEFNNYAADYELLQSVEAM